MTEAEKWAEGFQLYMEDLTQEIYDKCLAEIVEILDSRDVRATAGEASALARLLASARVKAHIDGEEYAENRRREYRTAVDFLWMAFRISDSTKMVLLDLCDGEEIEE